MQQENVVLGTLAKQGMLSICCLRLYGVYIYNKSIEYSTAVCVAIDLPVGGAVAEWVRALDWRLGGPGFASCSGNFTFKLWQFRLPRFARDTNSCRSLLSMSGEVKDHSSLNWKCITCHDSTTPYFLGEGQL